MRKLMIMAISLMFLSSCASIQDTITGAIQSTIKDAVDKTVQSAEQALKDKLGNVIGSTGSSSTVADASLNVPFRINMNQNAYINSELLNIKFLKIIEDSRCPSDVQCIQAGQVTAQVNVAKNSTDIGNYSFTLKPGSGNLNIQKIDNYTFTLNSVEPVTINSNNRPNPSDYYITLTAVKP